MLYPGERGLPDSRRSRAHEPGLQAPAGDGADSWWRVHVWKRTVVSRRLNGECFEWSVESTIFQLLRSL